jgi:type II secretory pathway pseudopilin PulG
MGQAVETNLEITGAEGENCLVKSVLAKFPVAEAVGKDALCKLPKGTYTKESLQAQFGDLSKLSAVCDGSAVDSFKAYSDSVIAEQGQADLVAQLKKQVEELQKQKEKDAQIAQDLIDAAQQNAGGLHSAAPAIGAGNGLPTGTAGQANTLQPGFRENPYRVTVTPEQMLSQRLAGGTTLATGATGASAYSNSASQGSGGYQAYQQANAQGSQGSNGQNSASVTLVKGTNTPQTGPETTAIALFASFAAMVFWKAKKVFA